MSSPDRKSVLINNEFITHTVEVIQSLVKRIMFKYQQRSCLACYKDLPVLEGEHICIAQGTADMVNLYFEEAYNSININLVNAMFVLDGDQPPRVSIDAVKEHYKDEIKQKLTDHMEFVNGGELKIARAIVYLSPLFKTIA